MLTRPECLSSDPAWVPARRGRLTASRMADAMSFNKDKKPSERRIKLMMDIVAERLADWATDHFVTDAMRWGLEQEAAAISRYEALTGEIVGPAALYHHPRIEWFSATPDGTIAPDGILEAKCPSTPKYLTWRRDNEIPAEHKAQILAQLACTGRTWCDFIAYDPRVRNPELQLMMLRWTPSAAEIEAVEQAAAKFLEEVEQLFHAVATTEPTP